MSSSRELYVYYRVDPSMVDAARHAIVTLQRTLVEAHPRLSARLLTKDALDSAEPVWMEIYSAPGGVSLSLQAAIEEAAEAVVHLLRGGRHVEVFVADER